MDEDEPSRPPWWRRIAVEWGLPVLAAVLLWQGIGWLRAPALPPQAPPFTLSSLSGEPVALDHLRGRTVVLNFWATWCGPCRVEAPSFAAFARNNPDIAVLGLAADQDPAKVRRAARELGLDYPILMADPATLAAYGVTTFPTTVIVGPQGEVRTAHTGMLFRPQLWWLTLGG